VGSGDNQRTVCISSWDFALHVVSLDLPTGVFGPDLKHDPFISLKDTLKKRRVFLRHCEAGNCLTHLSIDTPSEKYFPFPLRDPNNPGRSSFVRQPRFL